ncbi:hypothetical protein GCM10027514_05240 [Azotobacter armeniacus]
MFLLAWATYAFIETPVKEKSFLKKHSHSFFMAGVATAACLVIGILIERDYGGVSRFAPDSQEFLKAETAPTNRCGHWINSIGWSALCNVEAGAPGKPALLVLGDSHAGMIVSGLISVARKYDIGVYVNRNSCHTSLLMGNRTICGFSVEDLQALVKAKNIGSVIVVNRFDEFVEGIEKGGIDDNGTAPLLSEMEKKHRRLQFDKDMKSTFSALSQLPVKLGIMKQVPTMLMHPQRMLAYKASNKESLENLGKDLLADNTKNLYINRTIDDLAAIGVAILEPSRYLCSNDGLCQAHEGNHSLYRDEDHLSDFGAQKLTSMFEEYLQEVSNPGEIVTKLSASRNDRKI